MPDIENLTIMFTDIVDFSNIVSSMSRTGSEKILKHHNKLLEKSIKQFGGQFIKSVGDSFLVVFRSPTDAVLCAMAMQDSLWEYNHTDSKSPDIHIRVALNTGEVRLTNNDVFGEAVNIASRLEAKTPSGQIYLTEAVYLSMNKNEVELIPKGTFNFKGVPDGIEVFQATQTNNQETENYSQYPYGGAHHVLKPASRSLFTVGKMFLASTTAIVVAFITWWTTITYMPSPATIEMEKVQVQYHPKSLLKPIEVIDSTPDITLEIRNKAEPLVESKNYLGLKNIVEEYAQDYPDNGYLQMVQGHLAAYYKDYPKAIKHYDRALTNSANLSSDPLLSQNLVKLLDHERIQANQLLAKHLSQEMVDNLAKRSGKPGLRGRYDAFYLLKDSGNIKKVDTVGRNIWDLRELEECRLKRVAVKELKRLKDPRALPALKEVVDASMMKRMQYFCLRGEAKQAIRAIKAITDGHS